MCRTAAVDRVFELSSNDEDLVETALNTLRRIGYNQKEEDEDTRVNAYESYISLRYLHNMPLSEDELLQEKKLIRSENSPRMAWLLSMGVSKTK